MTDAQNIQDYLATGEWPRDVQGKMFKVGQKVAKAYAINDSGSMGVKIHEVTYVSSKSVGLDGKKSANLRWDRLAIIEE